MESAQNNRVKRLLYQSWYRGCKETDRLLGYFAKEHIHELSEKELDELEQFLEEDDKDIFNWLTGKEDFPQKYASSTFIEKLKAYDFSKNCK